MFPAVKMYRALAGAILAALFGAGVVSCGLGRGSGPQNNSVLNIPPAMGHRCQLIVFASPHRTEPELVTMDGQEGRALRPKSFVVYDTMPGTHRMRWDSLGLETRPLTVRPGETVHLAVILPDRFSNQWGGTVVGGGQVEGLGRVQLVKLSEAQARAYQTAPGVYR